MGLCCSPLSTTTAIPQRSRTPWDHTFVEWQRKPVAFVGWGDVGGARAVEQLRLVTVEFEMAPLRHAVHILPDLMRASRASEPFDPSIFAPLQPKLESLFDDLIWWTEALATARTSVKA